MIYLPAIEFRECSKCQAPQPLDKRHFYLDRNKRGKRGFRTVCRMCLKATALVRAWNNIESVRANARERYRNNSDECQKKAREWQKAHPQQMSEHGKANYIKHRDAILSRGQSYRRENRAKRALLKKNYAASHPQIIRVHWMRRLARKRNLPDNYTAGDWLNCLDYFELHCAYCGANAKLHADHWIPLSDPRPDNPGTVAANIIPACQQCNQSKSNIDPLVWLNRKCGSDRATGIANRVQTYFEWVQHQDAST